MDSVLETILAEHRQKLIETWAEHVENEIEHSDLSLETGHQGWMNSFVSLFARVIGKPWDANINDFVKSLVQKGYLSRFKVGVIVHIFQLFHKAVIEVSSRESTRPLALGSIKNIMDPIIVAACNYYEERLVRSEEKFEALIDSADLLILNIDISGKVEKVNKPGSRILGLPQEEIVGKPLSYLVHPEDLEIITRSFGHVLAGNPQIFAIRTIFGNSGTRNLDMTLTPVIEGGRITNMRGIARNVTEKIELQKKLTESERKYRNLIEKAGDAIILLSIEDGNILEANTQARKMTGLSIGAIRKFSIVELFDKKDEKRIINFLQAAITTGTSVTDEVLLLSAMGPDINVTLSGSVIEYAGNKVLQVFVKDTGLKLRAEKKIIEQSKRLANSEVKIAHLKEQNSFLKRPSRAWGLLLGLFERLEHDQLLADIKEKDRIPKDIALLLKRSAEILRPLNTGNNPALIHVGKILTRYMDIFKRIYKNRLVFKVQVDSIPLVQVAPEDFETAIVSLLNQAIQVSLDRKNAKVAIRVSQKEKMVTIEIRDSAESLEDKQWKDLFANINSFPKRDGNILLGARKFLERYGGGLIVKGDPNGGNVTTLYLPAEQQTGKGDYNDYQMVILDESAGKIENPELNEETGNDPDDE